MTEITWDDVGSRRFEAGVSRGVFYPSPTRPGVPWNGLTSVVEADAAGVSTPVYLDGVKITDRYVPTDFAATIQAFTYPDELEEFIGVQTYGNGLEIYGQGRARFGLSYRTGAGDDIQGLDQTRKIHLVYNAIATPSARSAETVGANVEPAAFEWRIDTKPVIIDGFRPTAHFVIDSSKADVAAFSTLEDMLYGRAGEDPRLPDPIDLLDIFAGGPKPSSVVDEDGGWTMTGDDSFFTADENEFAVRSVRTTYSDKDEYTMPTDE